MTHWTEFTEAQINTVPSGIIGIFQLSNDGEKISYVGRSDSDLQQAMREKLGKGYSHFQWVKVPWAKEAYEMHCRLYHFARGLGKIDNEEHPYPPAGEVRQCVMSTKSPAVCDL